MIVSRFTRGVYYLRSSCPDCGEFFGFTEGCQGCVARKRRYRDPHKRFLQAVEEPVYEWRPFVASLLGIDRDDDRIVAATITLGRADKLVVYLGRDGSIAAVGLPRQSIKRRKKLGRRHNVFETLISLGPVKASYLAEHMHIPQRYVMQALHDLYYMRLVEVERVSEEKLGVWSPRGRTA